MASYDRIMNIVDANLIYCLIPMILTLVLIELLFKNRFPTKRVLSIICWLIIAYAAINLVHFLIGLIFYPDQFGIVNRSTGAYRIAYWVMLLLATILPFTLLSKKLSANFWYVLLVATLLKSGAYFERFVIVMTSVHRDYSSQNLPIHGLTMLIVQGALLAILTLGIFRIIERNRTVYNKS